MGEQTHGVGRFGSGAYGLVLVLRFWSLVLRVLGSMVFWKFLPPVLISTSER